MESKQSSVEWLIDRLCEKQLDGMYVKDRLDDVSGIIEQARSMHRGEIEYANYIGQSYHAKYTTDLMMRENAEYYYIEQFKTKSND